MHSECEYSGRNKGQKLVGHFLKILHFYRLSIAVPLKISKKEFWSLFSCLSDALWTANHAVFAYHSTVFSTIRSFCMENTL